jgi:hypothetical protein
MDILEQEFALSSSILREMLETTSSEEGAADFRGRQSIAVRNYLTNWFARCSALLNTSK